MPINCDTVLAEMIQSVPGESGNIDQSVVQIEEVQAELDEKNASIRECVTDKAKDDLTAYLQGTKLAEIQATYPTAYLVFGPDYGTIDFTTGGITDWEYRVDLPIPPPPAPPPVPSYTVVYSYTPGSDALIDGWVSDYAFGNDYITHPVGIGAAYGLEPLVAMYEQGKATLLGNQAKIEASVGVFEKYLS